MPPYHLFVYRWIKYQNTANGSLIGVNSRSPSPSFISVARRFAFFGTAVKAITRVLKKKPLRQNKLSYSEGKFVQETLGLNPWERVENLIVCLEERN